MPLSQSVNVNEEETRKFNALADQWWDPNGSFRPLHLLNPCRLDFINRQIEIEFDRPLGERQPFSGLSILDVGCGGGLLCEPLSRLGASVTGIDLAERNIPVAEMHAKHSGLSIDYRCAGAEDLAKEGNTFDIVLGMEVIEHVPDPQAFISVCASLMKPGGLLVTSTINRNPKSFLFAIIGAEYILQWLPKGTHDWKKFIKPEENMALQKKAGLEPVDCKGFVFNPFLGEWKLSGRDTSINYATAATKPSDDKK